MSTPAPPSASRAGRRRRFRRPSERSPEAGWSELRLCAGASAGTPPGLSSTGRQVSDSTRGGARQSRQVRSAGFRGPASDACDVTCPAVRAGFFSIDLTRKKPPPRTTTTIAARPTIIFGSLLSCSRGVSFLVEFAARARQRGGSRFSVDSNGRLSTIN